jgi:hypothetical protein
MVALQCFPQVIRMLIQYVLDVCITSVLHWPLIVSHQLARFAPSHSSLRSRRLPRLPRASRGSGRGSSALDDSYSFFLDFRPSTLNFQPPYPPNSLPLNLFADPHPLTPVASIFYKKGGGGRGVPRLVFAQFLCNLSPLDATLIDVSASVDSKPLTRTLSSLDATLTKNRGVGLLCGTAILGCALPRDMEHGTRPLPV